MSEGTIPVKKHTRVTKIATSLWTILAGMAAKNDIKLAKVKGDREAEQYCFGYDAAIIDMKEILNDLIPFDN